MISSKQDYKNYILADKKANHINDFYHNRLMITWKYLKCMRRLEYVVNCKHGFSKDLENLVKI